VYETVIIVISLDKEITTV